MWYFKVSIQDTGCSQTKIMGRDSVLIMGRAKERTWSSIKNAPNVFAGTRQGYTALEVEDEFDYPVKNRKFRDVFFIVLLAVCCFSGAVYTWMASPSSDWSRMVHGVDTYGNTCGIKNVPLLNTATSGRDYTDRQYYNTVTNTCEKHCDPSSFTLIGYYCVSFSSVATLASSISSYQGSSSSSLANPSEMSIDSRQFGADVTRSWKGIVETCAVALLLCIGVILMFRFAAGYVVWTAVYVIAVTTVTVTGFLWYCALAADPNNAGVTSAVMATVGTIALLVLMVLLRQRIRLAIALFQEASRAVTAMPLLLLVSILTLVSLVVAGTVWALAWLYIESAGTPTLMPGTENMIYFKPSSGIWYLRLCHIFALFWLTQFVLACQDLVVAGAVSAWYFKRNKSRLGWPVTQALQNTLLYHLGSAAFGALLVGAASMVKWLLHVLKWAQKQVTSDGDPRTSTKCVLVAMDCLERFLAYLARNAYIEIAIFGCGFYTAGRKGFSIVANNPLRVLAINFVKSSILLLKIAVGVTTFFIGYAIIKAEGTAVTPLAPVVVSCVVVAVMVHCVLTTYEMVIDTLFVCFCEDCAMNDGVSRPYFMTNGLTKFTESRGNALEQQKC